MAFPYSWANNLLMEYNLCHRWSGCWHADPDPTTNVLVSTLACPKLIWYSVTDYQVWKARNDNFLGSYFLDFRACLQTFGGPDQGAQALAFIRVLNSTQGIAYGESNRVTDKAQFPLQYLEWKLSIYITSHEASDAYLSCSIHI